MAASSSVPSSGSGSGQATVGVPDGPNMVENETCGYMASPTVPDCMIPRPCRSCLEKSGCFISNSGYCSDQQDLWYEYGSDYRQAIKYNNALPNATNMTADSYQSWYFLSLETKYCPVDDAICKQCTASNFFRSWDSWSDSRFCVGTDGCVCIMSCEANLRYPSNCLYPTETPSYIGDLSQVSAVTTRVAIGLAVFLVAMLVGIGFRTVRANREVRRETREDRQRRRQARQQEQEQSRQRRLDAIGVGLMNLAGWNKYRRDLIEKENLQLNSTAAPYVAAPETPVTVDPSVSLVEPSQESAVSGDVSPSQAPERPRPSPWSLNLR